MKQNLLFVLGTAGELIKTLPLILEAQRRGFHWKVLSTGQSGVNFIKQWDAFGLDPSQLIRPIASAEDLKSSQQALRWFIHASMLKKKYLHEVEECGAVIVHGDTLSTLVGAWWAQRSKKKLIHIEAGLRSQSLLSPFPEEINRRLVSRWVDLHFAPDPKSVEHLQMSKVGGEIFETHGNTMKDALGYILDTSPPDNLPHPSFALANIHRFENLNSTSRWNEIKRCLFKAAEAQPVYLVLHPSTQEKIISESLSDEFSQRGIRLLPRMMFNDFAHWLKACRFLITDGGSNQEECYYLGKPCLILRSQTERLEGLAENCILSKFNTSTADSFLLNPEEFKRSSHEFDLKTSRFILDCIERHL